MLEVFATGLREVTFPGSHSEWRLRPLDLLMSLEGGAGVTCRKRIGIWSIVVFAQASPVNCIERSVLVWAEKFPGADLARKMRQEGGSE
ncbi:hypothetical protein BMW22_30800 (plasmid) [Rhizobium leguminosarum]|uniref:Uncharacterized protein n=1 Tax=Rhizobium leguminosarum TaxID=384 RepID=A0A1L3ZJN8_RHILE|nr:hypothetical protein BMW22_30800 [Rhizobium leguminosarum]ASR10536.1 hypothetical protein CHY08_26225 [Rhizobium leguminosarum bv. viciae]